MGPGEETIKLPGVIYPHYRGGLGQVQSMRQVAIEGAPMLLIDSLGHIYGRWVIRRVEERTSDYLAGGVPRKIEFDLEIVYIDDGRQGVIVYRTRAGDSLDWVCWQHYGEQSGALEVVLEANQGLADYGPVLPRGLAVVLPDIVVPESRKEVSLWD